MNVLGKKSNRYDKLLPSKKGVFSPEMYLWLKSTSKGKKKYEKALETICP